ncbi:MAG: hypothetical protein RLZZ312_1528 [Bacteroidota bacterium]
MKYLEKFYPHIFACFGFIAIAILFFSPVLREKSLYQSDIAQYTGMAKEQNDFRAETNSEPFWTNSAFGGMPTYQMGANYPHNYIKKIDAIIRFLPRPADYLFLYFIGVYLLLTVLKTDPLKAFFGALAFGFSTYMIVILGVGHNAKAHAIGYMPFVVAGVLLVFQRKYIFGGLLSVFAIALEIVANHFQMTYYLLILLGSIAVFYGYNAFQSKELKSYFRSIAILFCAAILAIGINATSILATSEYANFSMRGKSELSYNADGSKNMTSSSMKKDYITEYSYGISESFNLIAARLFGGSNSEKLDEKSNVYEFISKQGASPEEALEFTKSYGVTYWGDQPIVAAPAYVGAIVFFLAVLCLFVDNRKIKYAFISAAIISLLLSWGKNFSFLTDFFIDFVPLYDKFRAVSSIQVILELCLPVLAIMGLQSFFKNDTKQQFSALWKTVAVSVGIVALLLLCQSMFHFSSAVDGQIVQIMNEQTNDKSFGINFVQALKLDRQALFTSDLMRSSLLMIAVAGFLFAFIKKILSQIVAIVFVGVIMVGELMLVSNNYFDRSNFVSKSEVENPFEQTRADSLILADKSQFRVYEIQGRLQARSSFFHKSVGGYSAVRPRRFDQIFEYIIDKKVDTIAFTINQESMSITQNIPIINALNIKYLIFSAKGGDVPIQNPFANGSAWFVSELKNVRSADQELQAIQTNDLKNIAVSNSINNKVLSNLQKFEVDNLATISVEVYKPNYIKYQSINSKNGFAVFSEMWYPKGWNVYLNGKLDSHFRVNFVLRGMKIPAGNHTIEFKFEPQVVKTGSMISLISFLIAISLLFGGLYFLWKNKYQKIK